MGGDGHEGEVLVFEDPCDVDGGHGFRGADVHLEREEEEVLEEEEEEQEKKEEEEDTGEGFEKEK